VGDWVGAWVELYALDVGINHHNVRLKWDGTCSSFELIPRTSYGPNPDYRARCALRGGCLLSCPMPVSWCRCRLVLPK
jgi:hypothetical protein